MLRRGYDTSPSERQHNRRCEDIVRKLRQRVQLVVAHVLELDGEHREGVEPHTYDHALNGDEVGEVGVLLLYGVALLVTGEHADPAEDAEEGLNVPRAEIQVVGVVDAAARRDATHELTAQ